ncbi:MAG: ATP-binding protein [Ruminococcus flavefaciens]|nr:ATP-binding protein [Ruminococcus flavefaciens]
MISGIFGLPGSGKSLFLGMIAQRAVNGKSINYHGLSLGDLKKYDYVYTNFSCDGCYKLDYDKLGVYNYENCLILVDEIMLLSDARDYRSFTDNLKLFYSEHRKSKCDFIYASQGYKDVDIKIRNRTKQYYYIEDFFLEFSRVRRIDFFFDIINFSITEGFSFAPVATDFFFWRPHFYENIDSYELINGTLHGTPDLIPWKDKSDPL